MLYEEGYTHTHTWTKLEIKQIHCDRVEVNSSNSADRRKLFHYIFWTGKCCMGVDPKSFPTHWGIIGNLGHTRRKQRI
jgi:hypothetical protein